MSTYAEAWSPQSIEEAMFQIDTGHDGEAFWEWGKTWAKKLEMYSGGHLDGVLDYGCGVGRVLFWIDGKRRVGIDVSMAMLNLAEYHSGGPLYVLGDGQRIPLPDESMDLVYSLLTLQHMDADDTVNIVHEAHRVLRPGRYCFLQFTGFGNRRYEPGAKLNRSPCQWTGKRHNSSHPAHCTIGYKHEDIEQLARAVGFEQFDIVRLADEGDEKHPYLALWGRK